MGEFHLGLVEMTDEKRTRRTRAVHLVRESRLLTDHEAHNRMGTGRPGTGSRLPEWKVGRWTGDRAKRCTIHPNSNESVRNHLNQREIF